MNNGQIFILFVLPLVIILLVLVGVIVHKYFR